MVQLLLFQPQPASLPLEAYLACALTGLTAEQRQLILDLSKIVAETCRVNDINLYEPRKHTAPVHHADTPADMVFKLDRERVLRSDVLIHLCHYPSTGAGEELDIASNALLPIILISHSETRVSRMVTGIPSFKLEIQYTDPEDLKYQLTECLTEIRPILEQRKMVFSDYEVNIVGNRIRLLREELGLTREEVVAHAPHLPADILRQIEESVDRVSNPTLIQLREIATILKTTVADLVEPDVNNRLMATLQDWISGNDTTMRLPDPEKVTINCFNVHHSWVPFLPGSLTFDWQ
ncbi:helix-turn-helix transcriptional regulator [Candidatus Poribacteria bacterium]|nr:helix-turn-helix transcriptional regulator [Candidatus Poribacteria bacterium]